MKVVLYCRRSKADDRAGKSVGEQEAELRAVAERFGWTIVDVIVEDGKGASPWSASPRVTWPRVVAMVEAGQVDAVAVWEISRLDRDDTRGRVFIDRCAELGVKICEGDRVYDPRDERDRKTITEDLDDARAEIVKLRKRVKRGLAANIAAGMPTQRAAYGYRIVRDERGRLITWEENSDADRVRWIFAQYLKGDGPRTIEKTLNDQGIVSPGGGRWTSQTVRAILSNLVYTARREDPQTGEITRVNVPAIVDESTFLRVAAKLREHSKTYAVTRPTRFVHLLTGDVCRCGVCGNTLVFAAAHGRAQAGYVCSDRHRHVSISKRDLDQFVTAYVAFFLARPDAMAIIGAPDEAAAVRAQREVARLEAELAELSELVKTRRGASKVALLDEIDEREAELVTARTRAQDVTVPEPLRALIKDSHGDARALRERFLALPMAGQREVVRIVLPNLTIAKGVRGSKGFQPSRVGGIDVQVFAFLASAGRHPAVTGVVPGEGGPGRPKADRGEILTYLAASHAARAAEMLSPVTLARIRELLT